MRTLILFFLLPLLAHAQKAGDAVQIEHNGTWYDGKVLQVKDGQFFITYNDWDETWNEWVGADRLKGSAPAPNAPPAEKKFKVGDRVEVEYGMVPEPATVMEVGENK